MMKWRLDHDQNKDDGNFPRRRADLQNLISEEWVFAVGQNPDRFQGDRAAF
jgi:hypothetical protein